MPANMDPQTVYVDDLPAIWSPVQWEQTEEEAREELETQAMANLLWVVDMPEAILRLALGETDIERAYGPPAGYDPEQQGDWDDSLLTFQFKRRITLHNMERGQDFLYVEYKVEDLGYWGVEITPERVCIERL